MKDYLIDPSLQARISMKILQNWGDKIKKNGRSDQISIYLHKRVKSEGELDGIMYGQHKKEVRHMYDSPNWFIYVLNELVK